MVTATLQPTDVPMERWAEPVELDRWPGHDATHTPPPAAARQFERRVRIPPGRSAVTIAGDCGELTAEVDVPVRGRVPPLVVSLPADSGG